MNLPGTVPPKVQNVYFTPSAISFSTSITSSSTMTLAGAVRLVGGGTSGGEVSTALTGSPCGGPKSPDRDPPVSAATVAAPLEAGSWLQAANSIAAAMTNRFFFILWTPALGCRRRFWLRLTRDTLIQVSS